MTLSGSALGVLDVLAPRSDRQGEGTTLPRFPGSIGAAGGSNTTRYILHNSIVFHTLKSPTYPSKCHAGQTASNGHRGEPERGFKLRTRRPGAVRDPSYHMLQVPARRRFVSEHIHQPVARETRLRSSAPTVMAGKHHIPARRTRGAGARW